MLPFASSRSGRCLLARFANSRASQAWYMDFSIALLLFTFTVVVYFSYANNFQKEEQGGLNSLISDAKAISSSLALSGYPSSWDNTTVIRIGIADDQRINVTKLKYLNQIDYSQAKKKFGTFYDYFVFFTNNNGEVLNINGICGAGQPLVNVTYNMKSAYYYSSQSDKFLKDFMNETFATDIYFGSAIDQLVSNLSKYGFIVFEHPDISPSYFSDFKTAVENYSLSGGLAMLSGQLVSAQGQNFVGVDFYKKSGQSDSDRNSTVNSTDQYLSLAVGENIVFRQAYYVENTSNAAGFRQIATFTKDGRNALSKWSYGNGTVYFFSDFDVSYFSGNFVGMAEDAAKAFIGGTCNPFNITQGQKKLVKIERYLNYNSQIVKMVVYVWQ